MNFSNACCSEQPIRNITNADRIRASAGRISAMSDEELAEQAATLSCCPPGYAYSDLCQPNDSCENAAHRRKCWLDWLKQEVKDGD